MFSKLPDIWITKTILQPYLSKLGQNHCNLSSYASAAHLSSPIPRNSCLLTGRFTSVFFIQSAMMLQLQIHSHSMTVNPSAVLSPLFSQQTLASVDDQQLEQDYSDYLDPNVWNRIFPDFSFTDLICETDGSLVWLGCQRSTLRTLALKITETAQKGRSAVLHQQTEKAFVTQNQMAHMVKILQVKETGVYRLVVMEYYRWSLADLLSYYTKGCNPRYTQSHLNFIVYAFNGILQAVAQLHRLGYVHRDLKLDNFMLDQDFNILLNDFELVTKELVLDPSLSGTLEYMAPERLSSRRKTEPIRRGVDVWSLGIILYELFTGQTPYNGQSQGQLLEQIYEDEIRVKQIPLEAMALIRQMLQIRSEKRITLEALRNTSFLRRQVDLGLIRAMVGQ